MNGLRRTLLASSMMVLCTAYGRYARAQQVTVTNGGSYVLDANIITADPGAAAIINDPISSASVSGTDISISGSGSVSTSGDFAYGVAIMGGPFFGNTSVDSNVIVNSGAITTSGAEAHGVSVFTAAPGFAASLTGNEITNYGSISTYGEIASGIQLRSESRSSGIDSFAQINGNVIRNSGVIETSANLAYGIAIDADSQVRASVALNQVSNDRSISTAGDNAAAIALLADNVTQAYTIGYAAITGNTITNSGSLDTTGASSQGILLRSRSMYQSTAVSSNLVTNSGDVITHGTQAAAIQLTAESKAFDPNLANSYVDGNKIVTTNRIATDGIESHGILLRSVSVDDSAYLRKNDISVSGAVVTRGNGAYGLFLNSGSAAGAAVIADNIISNVDSIETTGDGATAIRLAAETSASGPLGASMDGNQITNSAMLKTSGVDAEGVNLLAYSTFTGAAEIASTRITNSGVISTAGDQAEGVVLRALSIYGNGSLSKNRIENSGTIQTAGATLSDSIRLFAQSYTGGALASKSEIVNSGSLSTAGSDSRGVYVAARSATGNATVSETTISNSGSIQTSGLKSFGILLDAVSGTGRASVAGSVVTNSGSISTAGDDAPGIFLRASSVSGAAGVDGALVRNAGKIVTSGVNADGITFFSDAGAGATSVSGSVIANGGTIKAGGESADAISLFSRSLSSAAAIEGNTITNSGALSVAGPLGFGILLSASSGSGAASISGNVITNAGSITAFGAHGDAIRLASYSLSGSISNTGNTINNAGSLISAYGNAVNISSGSGNTLKLQDSSFIGGLMKLGYGDTVELDSSASHSRLWTFSVPQGCASSSTLRVCAAAGGESIDAIFNTSGPVPWFSTTDGVYVSYATFDATGVAARGQVLGDTARMNSGFMQQGLSSLEASTLDYRFWLTGNDSQQTYEGSGNSLDQDVGVSGGALGAAMRLRDNTMLGGMLALNHASVTADSHDDTSQDNSTEGFAGGLFLRHLQSGFTLDGGLNLGWGKTSTKRFVNDNLADNGALSSGAAGASNATLGNSNAKGDYGAWWFSPEVAAAYEFAIAEGASLTPSARLRYAVEAAPGYSENMANDRVADTDASAAAKIDSYTTGVFEADIALEAAKAFEWGRAGISAGYIIRQMTGNDDVTVTMLGESLDVPVDASNFYAPYLAADLRWDITEQFDFTVDGRAVFASGDVGLGAMASISGSF